MKTQSRRRYPRTEDPFEVRVVEQSGASWTGEAVNLSPFGMKVRNGTATPNAIARLEFNLPGGGRPVAITSLVERNDPDGVAFAFADLSRSEFALVRQAVDGLLLRKKLWILVVEDDPLVGDVLADYVEAEGHVPILMADAENALAYAIQDPPDAILLDLRLPGMSGMELLEELVRRAIRIPVVVISGSADPDALRCLKLGALDYLQKPVTIDRLRLAIDALDLKSLEQRLAEIDVSISL
jgi:CheY-like chemotaxis protein